ncbi:MAG: PD40 domain-containing protein [Opitutales bacterium]|nr:PD40 domain-containing protein [Opitutales bacterium]
MMHATRTVFLSLFCSILCSVSLIGQGDSIRLPDVVGATQGLVRTVQITADDADIRRTATALFQLHGGIDTSASGRPDFEFRYDATGERSVRLTIRSGGQDLLQQNFEASNRRQAVARASDFAVRRTLGIPGFFSGRLAFVSDRSGNSEIYSSDILFTQVRQLTSDQRQCLLPNLSPDGRTLLYTSYHRTGFPDIFKVDVETGRRTVFAAYRGTNTGATFSPDGRRVAMILSGTGNSQLYVSDPDGRDLRRLTETPSLEADPSWSPDGRRIVFTSDLAGRPQIYTIDASGSNMRRLPTNISRNCSEPNWNQANPDLIAFTAAVSGSFQIALYSFEAGESRFISQSPGDAVHPMWLNDGRHLIYTERTRSNRRLMILDTETGRAVPLSPSDLRNVEQAHFIY